MYFAHLEKVRRSAGDGAKRVLAVPLHHHSRILLRLNRRELRGALLEKLHVVHRHALGSIDLHATLRDALGVHLEERGPEFGDAVPNRLLSAGTEGDHRDDRSDPDDDAKHRQGGTQLVRSQ